MSIIMHPVKDTVGMCRWTWLDNRCGRPDGHEGRHAWELPGHAYPEAIGPNGQQWEAGK